ncbi:MAG TPA: DUF1573 domain-containing protein [Sedimentisphaerales bacterium]|nr:DUF1573 domain-containing protein [Sedimentisphaerales bacterium]
MERGRILVFAVISTVTLSLIGCAEHVQVSGGSKPVPVLPKPSAGPAENATAQPEIGKGGPKISFEKVICDRGELDSKRKQVCEFAFSNVGDAVLKIDRIETCCGFRGTLKGGRKEYAPGEQGIVVVEFDASRFRGSLTKYQHVYSNDKSSPRVQLTTKATLVEKVRVEPEELRLLLGEEDASCPQIKLASVDNQAFSIKSFASTGNCISVSFDRSAEARSFVLEPRVDIEKLKRNLNGHVRIGLTYPQCDSVIIPFAALAEFALEPSSIIVRDVEAGKPTTRSLWVLNNYGEDFEIESASSDKGFIKVLSQEKVGRRYKLELEITPPPVGDKVAVFTDVFRVNIKGGRKLSVDCRGFY